jgi:predicted transposase/invertase (TIGR01784 family)
MGLLPIDADILPASDDRIFKLILTSPDGRPALIDLISATLKRPVVDVLIRNNEPPPTDVDEKAERLDVNCTIDDGSQIDIEMQASHIQEIGGGHENLKGKSIYYLCDLHSSQSSKGVRRYDQLVQTYQVTFCTYTVFPELQSYTNSFSMRHDTTNALLSEAIHIIYVELSKLSEILKKSVSDMTDLEKWSVFFRYAEDPAYRDTVNKVIESKEAIQMAGNLLMSISKDERERAVFRSRRMYQTDMESNFATAEARGERKGRAEGRAEGRVEGRAEGRVEGRVEGRAEGKTEGILDVARKMKAGNIPYADIAEFTGLTVAEIAKLQ